MKPLISLIFILIFVFVNSAQEFSPDWQKIPETFNGNDFELIYKKFISNGRETAAQFNERIDDYSAINIGGGLTADKTLVFVYRPSLPDTAANHITFKYDADTETLNAVIGFKKYKAKTIAEVFTTTIKSPTVVLRQVDKSPIYRHELAFTNINAFGNEYMAGKSPTLNIKLKMPSRKAQALKDKIGLLCVARLEKPFFTTHKLDVPASSRYPFPIIAYFEILMVKVSEIWLFDTTTGEVLSKTKPAA